MNDLSNIKEITIKSANDQNYLVSIRSIFKFIKNEKLCSNNFTKYINAAERFLSNISSEIVEEAKLIYCSKLCFKQLSIIPSIYRTDILHKLTNKFSNVFNIDVKMILESIFVYCVYSHSILFMDKLDSFDRINVVLNMENDIYFYQQFLQEDIYSDETDKRKSS